MCPRAIKVGALLLTTSLYAAMGCSGSEETALVEAGGAERLEDTSERPVDRVETDVIEREEGDSEEAITGVDAVEAGDHDAGPEASESDASGSTAELHRTRT